MRYSSTSGAQYLALFRQMRICTGRSKWEVEYWEVETQFAELLGTLGTSTFLIASRGCRIAAMSHSRISISRLWWKLSKTATCGAADGLLHSSQKSEMQEFVVTSMPHTDTFLYKCSAFVKDFPMAQFSSPLCFVSQELLPVWKQMCVCKCPMPTQHPPSQYIKLLQADLQS